VGAPQVGAGTLAGLAVAPALVPVITVQVVPTGSTVALAQSSLAGAAAGVLKVVVTAAELPLVPPQLVTTLTV
jgi:hypothetical protein